MTTAPCSVVRRGRQHLEGGILLLEDLTQDRNAVDRGRKAESRNGDEHQFRESARLPSGIKEAGHVVL
jgi:hypothetical protein